MSVIIRSVSPTELDQFLPDLVPLLQDTVNGDVPLGFLPPISSEQAREYWQRTRSELQAGSRILLVALDGERLVGSGQLLFSSVPNGHHRVELQKLFVNPAMRGRGIGRALMEALHQVAVRAGRRLVVLQTRRGLPAVQFYRDMGYQQAGVIPGYTIDATGKRYDTVTFYHELTPPD